MKVFSAPLNICLAITNQCNLHCKYCYVSDTRQNQDLPTQKLLDVIAEMGKLKVFDVEIFGGEPFLRKDFFVILESLSKLRIGIVINTNGTLISKDIARRLTRHRVRSYGVSLDGSTASIHDSLRGAGSFKQTLRGIQNLVDAKLPVKVFTTITPFNHKDLENTILFAKKLGANGIELNKLRYMGNAADCRGLLPLPPEERFELLQRLRNLRSKYGEYVSGTIYRTCDEMAKIGRKPKAKFPLKIVGCHAATTKCAIRPDGWVTPCESLWYVKAGDLKKQSLRDIWNHSPVMKQFRKMAYVHEKEVPGCKGCEHLYICYQTSRCQPHYYPGRFKHKEYYCWKTNSKT